MTKSFGKSNLMLSFTFQARIQRAPSYWSILFVLKSLFILTKNFGQSNLILIFTFQSTAQRAPSYWSIDEASSYLASSPYLYDKKLWKIEFDTDFHFSNYCSKSPFILILWSSPFLFGLKSLFIMTQSFGKSNLILIFTFQTTTQRAPSYWSIDEAPSYLASSPF